MTLDEQLMKTLTEIAVKMQNDIKKLIKLNGSFASGVLYDSVKAKALKDRDGEYSITIDYVYYGLFVEKGRNPSRPMTGKKAGVFKTGKYIGQTKRKLPPINDIREWTKLKGIPDSAVFPIARSIAQEGYKGKTFLKGQGVDIVSDYKVISEIVSEMGKAFKDDITKQIMRDTKFFGVPGIPKGTQFI